jgi:hypothetical protein
MTLKAEQALQVKLGFTHQCINPRSWEKTKEKKCELIAVDTVLGGYKKELLPSSAVAKKLFPCVARRKGKSRPNSRGSLYSSVVGSPRQLHELCPILVDTG